MFIANNTKCVCLYIIWTLIDVVAIADNVSIVFVVACLAVDEINAHTQIEGNIEIIIIESLASDKNVTSKSSTMTMTKSPGTRNEWHFMRIK